MKTLPNLKFSTAKRKDCSISKKEQEELYADIKKDIDNGENWKSAGWGENFFYVQNRKGNIEFFGFMETAEYRHYNRNEKGLKKLIKDIIHNQKAGL